MSATPTTMTQLNKLAKDYWSEVYVPLMNTEVPLKMQFGKLENAMFTGKVWIFGVKNSIGGAAANAGANKTLPQAQTGLYAQGQATMVRTYVRMALDGFALEVTKSQAGSYRPALAEVMGDRLAQIDLEVNRQLFCNGDGHLALIPTGATSATQTLGSDYGVTNGGNGTRHIYVGDSVNVYDTTGVTNRGTFTVSSVNQSTGAVVLSGSVATSNGDIITRSTADTDNLTETEALGLLASVKDSGTFETLDPTTAAASRWKATRDNASGVLRDITDTLVMKMILTLRSKSRLLPNLIVCRPGIVQKYSEIFLPLRRLDGQDVQLVGGYRPVAQVIHAGGSIPVMDDLDCPDSRMFFLNTSAFKMADIVGTQWAAMDGAQFDRVVDKDAIEGYIRKYWNLITIQRNANGVIEDLNDVASIDRLAV